MNGLHDLGGIHGLGPIVNEPEQQSFHHPWEGRVHAMSVALGSWGAWNLDRFRLQIESLPGQRTLAMSYYEKWLSAMTDLAIGAGLITAEEYRTGHTATPGAYTPRVAADQAGSVMLKGSSASRPAQGTPRFQPGQTVRARNMHPAGHTRLPRYVRGRLGEILSLHGHHVFSGYQRCRPGRTAAAALYTVRFMARELWGEDAPARDSVCGWKCGEGYLDPA